MATKFLEIKSQEITLKAAKELVRNYNHHDDRLRTTIDQQVHTLTGLTMDRQSIELILNNTDHDITKIFIAFGYHFKEDNELELEGFTTVLFGIDDSKNLVLEDNVIIDYCQPCPDKCPDNINDLTS